MKYKSKIFDYGFMSLGIILQVICFLFSKDDILSFMGIINGVVSIKMKKD